MDKTHHKRNFWAQHIALMQVNDNLDVRYTCVVFQTSFLDLEIVIPDRLDREIKGLTNLDTSSTLFNEMIRNLGKKYFIDKSKNAIFTFLNK